MVCSAAQPMDPKPAEPSAFVDLPSCDLCGRASGLEVFREEPLDSPRALAFLNEYYGGTIPTSVVAGELLRVLHCPDCDFYWHARVLDSQHLHRLYESWIDPEPSKRKQESLGVAERMHLCELIVRWLTSVGRLGPGARLVDVGGGWGTLASCARALGCDVRLVETSPSRLQHVRSQGIETVARLDDLPDGWADLVVMQQALEHIPSPLSVLRAIARVVRPGGGLAVGVPRASADAPVLAKGPFQPLEHVNGFTAQSLELALTRAGFRVAADPSRHAPLTPRGVLGALRRNLRLALGRYDGSATLFRFAKRQPAPSPPPWSEKP